MRPGKKIIKCGMIVGRPRNLIGDIYRVRLIMFKPLPEQKIIFWYLIKTVKILKLLNDCNVNNSLLILSYPFLVIKDNEKINGFIL